MRSGSWPTNRCAYASKPSIVSPRADPGDALVGLDRTSVAANARPRNRVPGGLERRVERVLEAGDPDPGDLHGRVGRLGRAPRRLVAVLVVRGVPRVPDLGQHVLDPRLRRTAAAIASWVATLLLANTEPASSAVRSTHTATIASTSSTSSAGMRPSATACVTPAATPACAGPQVRVRGCRPRRSALLTNSVIGFTGQVRPEHGEERDVAGAGRRERGRPRGLDGPALAPDDDVDVRGVGAVPANDSPISVRAANCALRSWAQG